MIPHIPPKGMQMVRYAGLYARNIKRKRAPTVHAALEALRLQFPLFDMEALVQTFQHLKWRERIKQRLATIRSNVPAVGVLCNSLRSGTPNAATSGCGAGLRPTVCVGLPARLWSACGRNTIATASLPSTSTSTPDAHASFHIRLTTSGAPREALPHPRRSVFGPLCDHSIGTGDFPQEAMLSLRSRRLESER